MDTLQFPQNSWQYVAMTYDGTNLRLYRNGTQVASQTAAAPSSTTADLLIGRYSAYTDASNWTGSIDEPAIYNASLPATTIQNHYNVGTGNTSPPTAPSGLSATGGAGQVALSWSSASGATGYKVFRGTSPGGESSTPIATPTGTSYTDTSVTAGTTYYYTVKATNSSGDSPASNEASATPTSSAYASAVLSTSGLVSYWRLDETSGTTANDQKGANPGTYTGAYTLNQPGALANDSDPSAAFGGGYVDVPNSASIQNLSSVTLEAWVYWTGSGEQFIMTKGSGGSLQGDLEVYAGKLVAQVGPAFVMDTLQFPQNSWQYVAMTYDGTTLRLYRNGTQVASQTAAAPAAPPTTC